jgi:CheY-like chemotaxis protein
MGRNFTESLIFIYMSTENRHIILYAEDDLDDLFIVQQAFENYNETITVVHAHNGFMALEYLKELQAKGLLPCLIILDMNMPGMDGRETLIRIRQSEEYKEIPVVVFTTSSHKSDKDFAQKWGAEFITKPLVYNELEELAKAFVSKCNFEVSKRA